MCGGGGGDVCVAVGGGDVCVAVVVVMCVWRWWW